MQPEIVFLRGLSIPYFSKVKLCFISEDQEPIYAFK